MKNDSGWRETGDEQGKVVHFVFVRGIACGTRGGNRQASPSRKDVNCLKCLRVIASILGTRAGK